LDSLAIQVRDSSREFVYTNKQDAFFYGETNADTRSSWEGFNVFGHEYLDDYMIIVDGKSLDRSQSTAIVYPDYLKRVYPDGIVEEVRLADAIPLFSVTVRSRRKPVQVEIVPLVTDGTQAQDFVVGHREHALMLGRKAHTKRRPTENYPVWLAVSGKDFAADHTSRTLGGRFAPFSMKFSKVKVLTIAFAVADESALADSLCQIYLANPGKYITQRRKRMERLLNDSWVETSDKQFDKALAWAKLSLDALIMNQVTKGIFAGLPWFNNYWGRDTFISLPGATLVTGRFSEAKEILRSFARYQQTDTNTTDFGRIPNIVTTSDKAYNTADGTPRFVLMAKQYVERSGDSAFIAEIYPTILHSIEGTLLHHVDSLGFLTHNDAETWMDAVGTDGPWSPRGNRANDIQALWARQLDAGIWFATQLGDSTSARTWQEKVIQLKRNFPATFLSNGIMADHLTSDGRANIHSRPNQIFVGDLVDDSTRAAIVRTVVSALTYDYGVASLSQDDENFHPYHQYEPYYPKDAAYHNGTVWTWLQGQVISELCRFRKEEIAAKLTANTVHQILDRGAVGTQSELLDAVPRQGEKEPRLSGTFSQAWNLAEFIRNFYDDYLGIHVDRYYHRLVLRPSLPKSFGMVKARINLDDRAFQIEVDQHSNPKTVKVKSPQLEGSGKGVFVIPSTPGTVAEVPFEIESESQISLTVLDTLITLVTSGKNLPMPSNTVYEKIPSFDQILGDIAFATPKIVAGLRSLRGPDYPLISHSRLKSTNPLAEILVDAVDPADDDVGSGSYKYPLHPHFKSGIFDLLRFTVSVDDSNAYFTLNFKALFNPRWHPEYGFQLTYAAIAIDIDGIPGSGVQLVPHNSHYMLNEKYAYEKLILVGGGVRLEDNKGDILAAYIPAQADETNPLGNIETATISFAVPLSYLGKPSTNWTFTVLTGGQDDHGGSGLGEFRTVNRDAGEWNGGGRTRGDESNVYDTLVTPLR
jgi:glycogen debranching enzyme